jgi:signal transduction histidine kinase/CheY-like chemotaxis protein
MDRDGYSELLRQQTAMAKFGELALQSNSLDQILDKACGLVAEALGTDLAKVMELQKDGKTLLVRAGVGWKPGVVGLATVQVADNTSEGLALQTGEAIISSDIKNEMRFRYPAFLIDNDVKAVANVVIIGGQGRPPFGILQIDSRVPRQFTDGDTEFLRGYANLLAAAVDRLRVFGEMRNAEDRLRHSQKLEAIGRLAAGVAHDFNNILQSIVGGLEMVLDEVGAQTNAHSFASVAVKAAIRGSSLTQHLLSYARKQRLSPRAIEFGPFLQELVVLLGSTLGHRIALDIRSEGMPFLLADPGQLETALLNIAINAAQAMPQGGSLTIEAHEESADGQSWAMITLTDTGVGMDEATLAQAVEPFFTTKGPEGGGLGLSMVQGFAEQSGGTLRLTSEAGRGTVVELRLPSAEPLHSVETIAHVSAAKPSSGRILLVDDSLDVLVTTGAFLKSAGYSIMQAESGDEALAILAGGGRFDALITDFAMPGLTGGDLINEARTIQPGLAAVLISGYARMSAMDENLGGPMVLVLRKPFQRAQLVEALRLAMHQDEGEVDEAAPIPSTNGT